MYMEFKAGEPCSQCGEVRGRILSLQYDLEEDGAAGEIDLCTDCVSRFIEGKVEID
ncbi:hypothetical protein M5X06_27975 [Paenibacillus alvei]|uniref:ClpX-type ZB domain-containing protein n=1 Tax=Paenibacillus alvei TaxID=44250 RepID=A0ABT4GQJ0_PAEAL|nr:hypothetical protein [Paenibacillus alvei]MCY9758945.1 hypothetical protein [Paenibacillus alvei]MCY9770618.1 hypothetical protein [Paenibacillus alvei]